MGFLRYGTDEFEIDDLALAHLQVAVSAKLRRHETFFLTWRLPAQAGSGRNMLWIDNGVPLRFLFSKPSPTTFDRAWLDQLAATSWTTGGMELLFEAPTATEDLPDERIAR